MTYDATLPYPRDLVGYGQQVPYAQWPGKARVAVQFVLNYEGGGENAVLHVDAPSYTDVRLYVERGIPGVIYGAGPRTVLESHAKRADERLDLEDLRRATKVIARSLSDLLS
jgi:acetylornithine deacetylase/succinyl-diaminopimelate desuccinylase-like protein